MDAAFYQAPPPPRDQQKRHEELPLFRRPTTSEHARDLVRLKERLEPVAIALAKRRGAEGITASEVITEGLVAGVLNADAVAAAPRLYAWVGPWLAALARRGALSAKMLPLEGGGSVQALRASERDQSHGNQGKVYLHPERAG